MSEDAILRRLATDRNFCTYIMAPLDFVDSRLRFDETVEVDVRAFANGVWVQRSAQLQSSLWYVCNKPNIASLKSEIKT
ncbi:Protein of unknown function [Gryllus bimaculatus]|nr:Protein of unknown function [Gryllus bimaculatus]